MKRYTSAWNEESGTSISLPGDGGGGPLSLEDLKRIAIEGLSKAGSSEGSGQGAYMSLPLEGRFDLMRPRKENDRKEGNRKGEGGKKEEGNKTEEGGKEASKERNFNHEGRKRESRSKERDVNAGSDQEKAQDLGELVHDHHERDGAKESQQYKERNNAGEETGFDAPLTPIARQSNVQNEDEPPVRWHTLPTPGPNEFPPSPRPRVLPLPVSPSPQLASQHYFNQDLGQTVQHEEYKHDANDHPTQPQQHQQHEPHSQRSREEPPRPISPPLLSWNPAIEPPPKTTPTPSAFPSTTYFPNVWDSSPSKRSDQAHQGTSLGKNDFSSLFQPPPPSDIPEPLRRQGHYRHVTGEDNLGLSPSPDRSKVKPVFPWEDKPRLFPGRVFPATDTPTPSLFLSPGSQSSPTMPSTPEPNPNTAHPPALSPLHGLPSHLAYANAWDSVPSIQKYASKLVRSPPTAPLAPGFDNGGWKKRRGSKSWDDRAEASSRDGDVEDEGDDAENQDQTWDEDSDDEPSKSKRRSRRGSLASTTKFKRKDYSEAGVQTIPREKREQGVQVSTEVSKPAPTLDEKRPAPLRQAAISGGRRQWPPSSGSNLLPPITVSEVSTGPDLPMSTAPVSRSQSPQTASPTPSSPLSRPSHDMSASPSPSPVSARHQTPQVFTPPPKIKIRTSQPPLVVTRQISNDSSLGSPPSSVGPMSPPEGQSIASPARKASRVWDPARGVELFKRGSEEVLARFLKMGAWDDESAR